MLSILYVCEKQCRRIYSRKLMLYEYIYFCELLCKLNYCCGYLFFLGFIFAVGVLYCVVIFMQVSVVRRSDVLFYVWWFEPGLSGVVNLELWSSERL